MEITMKEIEEINEMIEKAQKKLNELRKQTYEEEKKILKRRVTDETTIPEVSSEILDKAAEIPIREVHLAVDFEKRFLNAIGYAGIKTLKELYEWISKEKPKEIRNVGEISIRRAKILLQDIPGIIQKVYRRRENIEENDTPIEYLIGEKTLVRTLSSKCNVKTLKQLYYEDVNHFKGIFHYETQKDKESKLVEILRRY